MFADPALDHGGHHRHGALHVDLAGRVAGQVERRLSQTETTLGKMRNDPQKVEVEVPVIPHGLIEMLAEMTARAEALAERVEKAGA